MQLALMEWLPMLLALVSPHYTSAACLPWWLPPFMANHGQNHSVSSGLTVAQGWKAVPSAFGWSVVYPMLEAQPTRLARDSALRAPNCTDPKCTGGCLCLPRDSADEAFRGETVVSTSYFTVSSLAGGVHRSKPKWEQQKDYATAIVFADYDGDGDQDVALRVECPETARDYNVTDVKIYLNQGNGRLVEAEGAGLTLHENRVVEPHTGWGTDNSEATTQAWGDYTGDGAVDLAVGYGNGRLRLFRNQNNGSFVEDSQSTLVIKPAEYRNWPSSLHFADFNNDGHLDLLVSMQHCTSAVSGSNPDGLFTATQVWINDGTGNFTTRNDIVCAFTQSAVVGDLNSDGLPDLVFLNYYEAVGSFAGSSRSEAGLQIFLNDASKPGASFVLDTYVSGQGGTSLDVVDVDGDGDLDLWVGSTVPEPALHLNNGAGKFTARPGALPQACSAKHARFADVDNDGDADMLMLCTDMLLYVNSGNGEFAKMTNWLQNEDGTSPEGGFTRLWNAEFTDVDNDNDLDILVETETGWALLLNSARGEAVEAAKLLDPGTGGSSYPIEAAAFGDVNGDGYPDLFVASSMASRPNLLYINNPKTRMFEASTDSGLTTSTQGSCRRHDHYVPVGPQDPLEGTSVNAHYMARAIRFADFDGDGDQDVFMTPSLGGDGTSADTTHGCAPRMLMNDGNGTFAEVELSTTMQSRLASRPFFGAPFVMDVRAMDIEVGDLDGDGFPDLVVAQSALRGDTVGPTGLGNGDYLFPDYLFPDAVGGIEIYLNSAQRFGEPTLIPFPGQEAAYWYGNQVQLGDLDGDGALDIVFAFVACGNATCVPPACTLVCDRDQGESGTDHRAIFWNDGSASFTLDEGALTPLGTALSNTITDALIFDMDNDGRMDIGFGTVGTNEFYRNLGNRKFEWVANSTLTTELTPRRTPPTNGAWSGQRDPGSTLAAGDYDQDGLMDLIVGRRNGGRTELFRGVGGGAFSRVPDATSSNVKLSLLEANDVAFADIDLDGDLDLLVTGYVADESLRYDFTGFHFVYSFDRCAENYGAVPGVGTRACVLCPMMSVGFGDVCMECPESRVRTATPQTPSGECALCTGSLTRLQGEQECKACPACPLGYYCDNEDSLGVDCGKEYYADGPKKCLEGFYAETEGQVAASCTGPCNSGHYCPAGSTEPAPESCTPQHFLMYDLSSTSNPKPLCQSCNGTLRSPTGQSSWYGSPSIAGEVHPYGKEDGDLTGLTKCWNYTSLPTGITLETLPLQDNHWRQFNWSLTILPCLKDGVCLGGDPVADVPFQCRAGHEGPFCAACSDNYFMQAGMCEECDGSSELAFVPFYILLLLVALVIAYIIYKACVGSEADTGDLVQRIGNFGASVTSDGATAVVAAVQDVTTEAAAAVQDVTIEAAIATAEVTQEKNRFARLYLYINKRGPQIMVKVKILIALYQVLDGIGLVFSIPYPSLYESSLAIIAGLVSIELPQVMPLACIYPWFDLYMLLLVKTIGPLVGIAGLCLLGALLDALTCCASESRKRIIKSLKQSSTDAIFFMLFLIYPSVSSTIFSVFVCEELPNGDSYLRLDFTIRCNDDGRPFWVFWAVISTIVYPLGVPFLYAYLLCYKYRPQLEVEKTAEAMKVYRDRLAEFAGKDTRELMSMTGPLCADDLADIAKGDHTHNQNSPSVQDLRKELGPFKTAFPEEAAAMPWYVDWDSRRDENVPLPSYVRKLISGYERRTYWFEIFECLRKVMLVGLPVFFKPESTGQLTLGLLICFFTYGVYNHFGPFVEDSDDILQTVCQVQIFFALLSSIILKADPDQEDTANILTIMLFVPPLLGLYLETPLPGELQKLYDYARGRCKFPYHGKTERETKGSVQVPAAGPSDAGA